MDKPGRRRSSLAVVRCILAAALATAPGRSQIRPAAAVVEPGGQGITLDSAIASAESGNIDVLLARLAIGTARATLRSADTAPNPVFSVNGVQIRPSQVGRLPYQQLVDTVVRVDVPLERGGKRQARTGAARAGIAAAEDDLVNARRLMRAAVTGAYYDLKAAEARLTALGAIADSYAEGLRVAEKQQRAGALSEGDLARTRVEALQARVEAEQARADRRDGQLALATLVGLEPSAAVLATVGDWPTPAGLRPEGAAVLALRRPDVLAAQARVEAARRNLDGAHALRHPDITVGAQYERADLALGVGNSVGVGFAVPLPVRNRYNGEVDAAGVALVQAETQARKAEAVATAEIAIARRAQDEASARRRLLDDEQLPAARRAARVAEFAYANGAMTLLELLDARRSLRTTEIGAIAAHADEARAIARLRAAETTGIE